MDYKNLKIGMKLRDTKKSFNDVKVEVVGKYSNKFKVEIIGYDSNKNQARSGVKIGKRANFHKNKFGTRFVPLKNNVKKI